MFECLRHVLDFVIDVQRCGYLRSPVDHAAVDYFVDFVYFLVEKCFVYFLGGSVLSSTIIVTVINGILMWCTVRKVVGV